MSKTLRFIFLLTLSFISLSCSKDSIRSINDINETSMSLPSISMYEKRIFASGDYNSVGWRIPVILSLSDGSLLAVCDKRKLSEDDLPNDIDVVSIRSTDNGRSWSNPVTIALGEGVDHGCGDPSLVQAANGDVLCAYVKDHGTLESTLEAPMRSIISRSTDFGKSWSEDTDLTRDLWGPNSINPDCRKYTSSFFSSGNGVRLTRGKYKDRIMFVVCLYNYDEQYISTVGGGIFLIIMCYILMITEHLGKSQI